MLLKFSIFEGTLRPKVQREVLITFPLQLTIIYLENVRNVGRENLPCLCIKPSERVSSDIIRKVRTTIPLSTGIKAFFTCLELVFLSPVPVSAFFHNPESI